MRVINAGVGGNTTEMARQRFEADVLSHQPQIAIIQFGINDATVDVWKTPPATQPRVSLGRYEANLRHFVQTLKTSKSTCRADDAQSAALDGQVEGDCMAGRLTSLTIRTASTACWGQYCEVVRRVAHEEGAELIDVQKAFAVQAQRRRRQRRCTTLDGMHPNDRGHRIVADLLRERILALAKKRRIAHRQRAVFRNLHGHCVGWEGVQAELLSDGGGAGRRPFVSHLGGGHRPIEQYAHRRSVLR